MSVLSIEMGTAARDYLINEGHFVDWHGYGEYEVVRPGERLIFALSSTLCIFIDL